MMDTNNDNILAYIEGRLDEQARLRLEEEMRLSPELRKEVDDLRFVYGISGEMDRLRQFDTDRAWKSTDRRIRRRRFAGLARQAVGYAAVAMFVPLLAGLAYFYRQSHVFGRLAEGTVEQRCAYGLVSRLVLPDSSVVWLNSGSSISYPRRFTDGARRVRLDGEAYFSVKADPSHRFDVQTAHGMTVSAYGTEFNVRAYGDETDAVATLAKGSVEVFDGESPDTYALRPGQQITMGQGADKACISAANVYMNTAWKDGKLVFRRTPMGDVVRRLARHFNVRIILKSPELLDYTFSATFTGESVGDIMRLIEQTSPIRYTIAEPEQDSGYNYSKRTIVIEKR